MREIKFYTVEEKNIMKQMLSTGESKRIISKKLAIQFNRSEYGIYQLLGKLRSFTPKAKTTKVVKQEMATEPIIQQPAEIGIEVPDGMTFEGKPKRIMLHSDHFRIYF